MCARDIFSLSIMLVGFAGIIRFFWYADPARQITEVKAERLEPVRMGIIKRNLKDFLVGLKKVDMKRLNVTDGDLVAIRGHSSSRFVGLVENLKSCEENKLCVSSTVLDNLELDSKESVWAYRKRDVKQCEVISLDVVDTKDRGVITQWLDHIMTLPYWKIQIIRYVALEKFVGTPICQGVTYRMVKAWNSIIRIKIEAVEPPTCCTIAVSSAFADDTDTYFSEYVVKMSETMEKKQITPLILLFYREELDFIPPLI